MWIDNEIYLEDLENIISDSNINYEELKNCNILITGGTGLIGSLITNTLLYLNMKKDLNINIYLPVRNIEKANKLYEKQSTNKLHIFENDVCNMINLNENIDYIIHAASQTSSKSFAEKPVETIETILSGTRNVLKFAKDNKVKKIVFLSTMETYGRPETNEKITEEHSTNLVTSESRNCYPIAKRMAENLCICYADEYGIETSIVRLTQTFGPGVKYTDGRVFAEFARCAIENRNIILHTNGETERNYLYTSDAVRAIFTVLLKGNNKEIYNASNELTYCSILEMANMVANKCTNNSIIVDCQVEADISKYGYAKTLKMNLDSTKLKQLGWSASVDLEDMYKRLIKTMEK